MAEPCCMCAIGELDDCNHQNDCKCCANCYGFSPAIVGPRACNCGKEHPVTRRSPPGGREG